MTTSVRLDIAPALLQWAKDRSGFDDERFTKLAPKCHAWLSGEERPTIKQAERFAKATHTPFGYLLLPEPPVEELPVADFRTLPKTRGRRPSPDLLDTIDACERRQEWFRTYAQQQQLDQVPFVATVALDDAVEAVAAAMRETFDFGIEDRARYSNWSEALSGLAERAETSGVLVMISGVVGANAHRKLDPDEFRGFALCDDLAPVVFVNGADTKAAQIFTLAHELAHLWLGASGVSDTAIADEASAESDDEPTVERWCNRVAVEFLVPRATLVDEVVDTDDEITPILDRLAQCYRVSTLVVLRRLFDASIISRSRFRDEYEVELARVMALKNARGTGGNFYYTQPVRVSKELARAVIVDTLEGHTLHHEAFKLLGINRIETFDELRARMGVG